MKHRLGRSRSLIMGGLAYRSPLGSSASRGAARKLWSAMLFVTWFTVDGARLYWHFKNPVVVDLMRDANILASLFLYGTCGVIGYTTSSLRELQS